MCNVRVCQSGEAGEIPVTEVIEDQAYREEICRHCAAAMGLFNFDVVPSPDIVEPMINDYYRQLKGYEQPFDD